MSEREFVESILPDEKYTYCVHCERAENTGLWLHYMHCPYFGCDGTPLDAWSWEHISEVNGYDEIPEIEKHYPMYSEKAKKHFRKRK